MTKEELVQTLSQAGREAADNAMTTMGYVVTVQDGWVVNLFQDGKVERIEPIDRGNRPGKDSEPGSDAR